jgi:hypothetical protein
MITNMGTTTQSGHNADAIAQANAIIAARQQAALGAGRVANRTYQPEMNPSTVF